MNGNLIKLFTLCLVIILGGCIQEEKIKSAEVPGMLEIGVYPNQFLGSDQQETEKNIHNFINQIDLEMEIVNILHNFDSISVVVKVPIDNEEVYTNYLISKYPNEVKEVNRVYFRTL